MHAAGSRLPQALPHPAAASCLQCSCHHQNPRCAAHELLHACAALLVCPPLLGCTAHMPRLPPAVPKLPRLQAQQLAAPAAAFSNARGYWAAVPQVELLSFIRSHLASRATQHAPAGLHHPSPRMPIPTQPTASNQAHAAQHSTCSMTTACTARPQQHAQHAQRTSSCIAFSPRTVTWAEIFSLRRMVHWRTV